MSGSFLYILIALLGIATVVYLIVADRRRMRVQRLRVKKLYASPMFEAMKPLLQRAQKYSVESLTIDKTGFTFRFLFPFGYEMRFTMADYGYPNLTNEKQEALLLLLEEFVPKFTTRDRYSFRSVRTKLLDGHVEYQYKYIIRIDYKNLLTRAPYYDGSLQSQLW
ncbi:MAG TPA: hypothetical protein PLP25_01865 [Candidatus Limiplasma sp.]|nr:hypothetical protein [Candidatus Limiplasma sp.]HPS80593.1 hypothetical protein [Candidatus Limiplasma sp.]